MGIVVRVKPQTNYQLEIEFKNGEVRRFDMRPYLRQGVFTRLKDQALFDRAYVACDTVCWPNDLDIAPDTLYLRSMTIARDLHQ